MDMNEQPTLGEVYRAVLRVESLQIEQGGRLRDAEQDIAVLKDRAPQQRDPTARWGAFGNGVGVVLLALWQVVSGR